MSPVSHAITINLAGNYLWRGNVAPGIKYLIGCQNWNHQNTDMSGVYPKTIDHGVLSANECREV